MSFTPDKKERKETRSFTLKPSTIAAIEELADAYGTNASRIMETLAATYIPKLLAQKVGEQTAQETPAT